MKITFNFDRDCRAFNMEPEDDLEYTVLAEMTMQVQKGSTLQITQIQHPVDNPKEFRVEMRVNGHSAKVTRNNDMLEQFKNT
jgi:hypothetical protein